jgi:hypothetical protein
VQAEGQLCRNSERARFGVKCAEPLNRAQKSNAQPFSKVQQLRDRYEQTKQIACSRISVSGQGIALETREEHDAIRR